MSNRFNIYDEYRDKFYRLPKVFFTNDTYSNLSNDAKMAWAILQDRLELSRKNGWIDDVGDYYFIFSNKNLEDILNLGSTKVSKIKKELVNVGLLEQIVRGLNKPNTLYLNKPEVTEKDVYAIEENEKIGSELSHGKEDRKTYVRKTAKRTSGRPQNVRQENRKTVSSDTEVSETEFSDSDDDDEKETRASAREELTQLTENNPHLKSLFDHLKSEMLDPYIVQDIMTEMLDQHVIDYRLIDARNQLDYMKDQISKGESYTFFGRFFVNGLKKRSKTALDVEHENKMAQQQQAQRDTSMYYDWLNDGLDPEV